jgi:hypothetical protein
VAIIEATNITTITTTMAVAGVVAEVIDAFTSTTTIQYTPKRPTTLPPTAVPATRPVVMRPPVVDSVEALSSTKDVA